MTRNRNPERWKEFTKLAISGKLGELLKNKMLLIPEEERELLEKVIEIAAKSGQVIRNRARRFPDYIETVRDIGLKAFMLGWLTDEEIDMLINSGGWKK